MAANATLVLPNPFTPLAFLPPTIADQFQLSTQVVVGGLSALVWDWLLALPEEFKIVRKSGFRGVYAVYLLSRLGTLAYCVGAAIFQTRNVANCQALLYAISAFYVLAMPATSLLFYIRVRAVWNKSTSVSVLFGALWVGNLGASLIVPFAINGGVHIGPTQRCIETAVRPYASIPIVLNALNDTLIFVAISVRILKSSCAGDTWRARFRSFFRSDGLPTVSKCLLQSGQLYYIATIGLSIVVSAMVLSPSVPRLYTAMLAIPNMALENAMACRVFRDVKLGLVKDDGFHNGSASRLRFARGHDIGLKESTFDGTGQVKVGITQMTAVAQSYPDEFAYDNPKGSGGPGRV